MNKKLYIAHPDTDFSIIDSSSILLDDLEKLSQNDNYHTTLGDLSIDKILSIQDKFDIIEYNDSNFDIESPIYFFTNILLQLISSKRKILNFECKVPSFLSDNISRTTEDKIIWHIQSMDVLGNFEHELDTSGFMVGDLYTSLIINEINAKTQVLTYPSLSNSFLRNIIFNIPFKDNDLLTIHLPDHLTETIYFGTDNTTVFECTKHNHTFFSPNYYTDDQYYFNYCTSIEQIVKYLRLKKIKFLMFSDMTHEDNLLGNLEKKILSYLCNYPEYMLYETYIETSDRDKNKIIAQAILEFFKK